MCTVPKINKDNAVLIWPLLTKSMVLALLQTWENVTIEHQPTELFLLKSCLSCQTKNFQNSLTMRHLIRILGNVKYSKKHGDTFCSQEARDKSTSPPTMQLKLLHSNHGWHYKAASRFSILLLGLFQGIPSFPSSAAWNTKVTL